MLQRLKALEGTVELQRQELSAVKEELSAARGELAAVEELAAFSATRVLHLKQAVEKSGDEVGWMGRQGRPSVGLGGMSRAGGSDVEGRPRWEFAQFTQ